jgi:hypothetical protein
MSRILILLSAFFICLAGPQVFGQEKKPTGETIIPAKKEAEGPKTRNSHLPGFQVSSWRFPQGCRCAPTLG